MGTFTTHPQSLRHAAQTPEFGPPGAPGRITELFELGDSPTFDDLAGAAEHVIATARRYASAQIAAAQLASYWAVGRMIAVCVLACQKSRSATLGNAPFAFIRTGIRTRRIPVEPPWRIANNSN